MRRHLLTVFLGFARANLFPMVKRMIARVNCFVFFGEELSEYLATHPIGLRTHTKVVSRQAETKNLLPLLSNSLRSS